MISAKEASDISKNINSLLQRTEKIIREEAAECRYSAAVDSIKSYDDAVFLCSHLDDLDYRSNIHLSGFGKDWIVTIYWD